VIDLGAELRAAGFSIEAFEAAAERAAERAIRRALEAQQDKLAPLAAILNISNKAASARLCRDPELRKLGVKVGTRTLFRATAVENYYKALNEG
jgi:hypothetical protein